MGRASIDQSSFLGGEWGPLSQGRHDDPRYTTALSLSLNGFPVEEGAWTRRQGTGFIVPSVGRNYAKLLPFEGSETCSFAMEFTDLKLRFITQSGVVMTNDAQTVTDTNIGSKQIMLSGAPGWSAGDLVQFIFPDATSPLYPYPQSLEGGMRSGVFKILGYTAHTPASGTVAFLGQPAVNDILTIDSTDITFVSGTPSGNQVQIGASTNATLHNLFTFLIGAGSPFTLMTYTFDDTDNIIRVQVIASGTGGNAFTFTTTSANLALSGAGTLTGGSTTGSVITVADDLGNGLLQSWLIGTLIGAQVMRHRIITTPYTGVPVLSQLRGVQAEVNSIILSSTITPSEVQITSQGVAGTPGSDPVFAFSALTMVDGPYLDPQAQSLTLSGTSGTVTATAGSSVFVASDVGRSWRVFTQPPIYNPASTYSQGDNVTDANGAWWVALQNINAGEAPGNVATRSGVATLVWAPNPTAGSWAWGTISAVGSGTSATFVFDTTIPGMVLNSSNGTTATEWRLGVFCASLGYPTCGVFYEGRLWLAGSVPNRFDTTTSNGVSQVIGTNTATFSPTDPNGNVLDDSGLSEILNSTGINKIQWMLGDAGGVLMGTLHGETLVGASVLGDPITPTSIQAHEHTRYGSIAGMDAIRAGMVVVFAQKNGRRVMEYLDDAFSGKPTARHLNEHAKHLTQAGIAQLAYTEEPVPMVWALMNNGMLTGCTYRRFSRFVQTPPETAGWHWNMHGGNRIFTSMCTVPGKNGLLERLFVVTNPGPPVSGVNTPAQSNYFIEIMQPPLDPGNDVTQGWFWDQIGVRGPGNSGYDCGGGNPSGFFPTGFFRASDSSSGNLPPNNFAGFTAGQSPPWGGVNILGNPLQGVYFPGTVALYNLPKFGQKHAPPTNSPPIDETAMSMSVWVGANDAPYAEGMLLSSPALSFAQAATGTQIVSGLLGGPADSGTAGNSTLAISTWGQGYPGNASLEISHSAGSLINWAHIMVSAKTDGAGNIVVTAAVNDTVIYTNQSQGTVGNNNKMWGFNSQQDNQADNGLNCWCIGGVKVLPPQYDLHVTEFNAKPITFSVPSIIDILNRAGINYTKYPAVILPGSTISTINVAVRNSVSRTLQNVIAQVTGSGGPSNLPFHTSLGYSTGFVGNVAELWVMPGAFIDWTNSANRNKFQEFDTISDTWGPIPLGTTGGTPGFGTPWLYLSGGPRYFWINRATGIGLTEIDCENGPIDYDTGLTGGLQQSQLTFP